MSLSRPLLIGLIASATLNVFLIGGVAGVAFVRLSSPPAPTPAPSPAPPVSVTNATPVTPSPASAAPELAAPAAAPRPTAQRPIAAPKADTPQAVTGPSTAAPVALPPGERLARPPLWTAGDLLSPRSQAALRQTLKAVNQKNHPITRQAREERRAALQALSTPGADPAEVARRLGMARALDQEARANVEVALASFAATLSPQERTVLAEGLRQVYAAPANGDGDRGGRRGRQ